MALNLFVTGTDTGVGKTLLSVLLTRTLLRRGFDTLAVKPLCSGGRDDAEALLAAQPGIGADGLDAINPWHFAEPLTPLVAARRARRRVAREEVVRFLRRSARPHRVLVVEGAGGLLSPLGEDFDARDLLRAISAVPVVVAANRLGVLNQVLLTWEALPPSARKRAILVLMAAERPGLAEKTNEGVLAERLGAERVFLFPRLGRAFQQDPARTKIPPALRRTLERIVGSLIG